MRSVPILLLLAAIACSAAILAAPAQSQDRSTALLAP